MGNRGVIGIRMVAQPVHLAQLADFRRDTHLYADENQITTEGISADTRASLREDEGPRDDTSNCQRVILASKVVQVYRSM